jgi:hypothetical protein
MDAETAKVCREAAMPVAGKHNPVRKPVDPGLVGAILEALENPAPARPERVQEHRRLMWQRRVDELNQAEELLELMRERFSDAPADMASLAINLAESNCDDCRAELLAIEAPDQAALQLKMRTFLEREGDMVRDTIGDELQGVFADVERLMK